MKLDLPILNRTISNLCQYLGENNFPSCRWESLTDDELFYEATICIIGSQMLYELALALANRLRNRGVLRRDFIEKNYSQHKSVLLKIFSEKIEFVDASGKQRNSFPRFKRRQAKFLSATARQLYLEGPTIKQILQLARNGRHARELLVKQVVGFGPKQASLFLRRIGYCADLAVLDVHILDYLKLARKIQSKPHSLANISLYERMEVEFRRVATQFGHSVGHVDLATWVTMRVAKREFAQ